MEVTLREGVYVRDECALNGAGVGWFRNGEIFLVAVYTNWGFGEYSWFIGKKMWRALPVLLQGDQKMLPTKILKFY